MALRPRFTRSCARSFRGAPFLVAARVVAGGRAPARVSLSRQVRRDGKAVEGLDGAVVPRLDDAVTHGHPSKLTSQTLRQNIKCNTQP